MNFSPIQNNTNPLVSVVVCTCNRDQYIGSTIDSILNQKINFTIEILIGDDASADGTKEILLTYKKLYPEIFTLVFHEENQGIGRNWAGLMKLVKGKYVALCDDDDYWHYDEKLQKQIDILEETSK
ncbi:MAG: glycosyltransferase [Paludibacter sp.]|nr:glycosyltransferase [Paludibacter sp.]